MYNHIINVSHYSTATFSVYVTRLAEFFAQTWQQTLPVSPFSHLGSALGKKKKCCSDLPLELSQLYISAAKCTSVFYLTSQLVFFFPLIHILITFCLILHIKAM